MKGILTGILSLASTTFAWPLRKYSDPFVRVNGNAFKLNGKPFYFAGIYDVEAMLNDRGEQLLSFCRCAVRH